MGGSGSGSVLQVHVGDVLFQLRQELVQGGDFLFRESRE
jgi:hypothetical protein